MRQFILTLSIALTFLAPHAQATFLFENEEWTLISGQTSEGMLGCTDSTGLTYDVGSELFINDCEYIICEQDDNWSDTMTVDDCFNIGCIAGACVDVSLFGQEGTYSSIEDCQLECGNSTELDFECVLDACVDIGQFGQEGSYSTIEECQESCGEQLPYECLFGTCVDISEFGQEGSYSSEEQCIEDCQSVAGEPSFECIAGMCIDIGQFGQEGSYDSLGECEKSCQSNNESPSYECVADMCVDVGQFGQEGSYDNLEECQIICEEAPASVQEYSSNITIAPNPFSNYTQIYSNNIVISYNLFDLNGRKVKSQIINNNSFKLDKDLLPLGMYYLEIVSEKGQSFNKLIIK